MAQEQGIPVIGETSGGGTCYLTNLSYPGAVGYSLSGNKIMLYENGGNVEAGAPVNYETVAYDADRNADYSKLYDIEQAGKYLDEYYAKVTPTKAAVNYTAPGGFNITPVIIILIAAAVAVIAVIAAVTIIKKRKKSADNNSQSE